MKDEQITLELTPAVRKDDKDLEVALMISYDIDRQVGGQKVQSKKYSFADQVECFISLKEHIRVIKITLCFELYKPLIALLNAQKNSSGRYIVASNQWVDAEVKREKEQWKEENQRDLQRLYATFGEENVQFVPWDYYSDGANHAVGEDIIFLDGKRDDSRRDYIAAARVVDELMENGKTVSNQCAKGVYQESGSLKQSIKALVGNHTAAMKQRLTRKFGQEFVKDVVEQGEFRSELPNCERDFLRSETIRLLQMIWDPQGPVLHVYNGKPNSIMEFIINSFKRMSAEGKDEMLWVSFREPKVRLGAALSAPVTAPAGRVRRATSSSIDSSGYNETEHSGASSANTSSIGDGTEEDLNGTISASCSLPSSLSSSMGSSWEGEHLFSKRPSSSAPSNTGGFLSGRTSRTLPSYENELGSSSRGPKLPTSRSASSPTTPGNIQKARGERPPVNKSFFFSPSGQPASDGKPLMTARMPSGVVFEVYNAEIAIQLMLMSQDAGPSSKEASFDSKKNETFKC